MMDYMILLLSYYFVIQQWISFMTSQEFLAEWITAFVDSHTNVMHENIESLRARQQ